ncbi:putative acyltransferase [bioreactor metagenome]|uniref:Putative acyltransferase n=1 Tax=bioreactor metagenome TaxID=1076179 RepID=A0A645CL19_9ZZZZ
MEDLAKLPAVFEKIGAAGYDQIVLRQYPQLDRIPHIHTGGNSSGIVDGACAMLLGNASYGQQQNLRPRARIVGAATCADEPLLSLGGPLPVTEKLLKQTGMAIGDIDLFEVNEAFAVVPMRYGRHFGIDPARINPVGGAIALGHPLGATGAILLGTVLDELERQGLATGLVTLCAAAGQSTAVVIERV